MNRIIIMCAIATVMLGGFFQASSQRRTTTSRLQRIQVNARTITTLPTSKKYVVDLTRRGVKYEFDPKMGQIDFGRVVVRTAQGEVAIDTLLEKIFPKAESPSFKFSSQSFILGTATTGSRPRASTALSTALNFDCDGVLCTCKGTFDCLDLIFGSKLCPGPIFCRQDPIFDWACNCFQT
jgi:hypothetical protein